MEKVVSSRAETVTKIDAMHAKFKELKEDLNVKAWRKNKVALLEEVEQLRHENLLKMEELHAVIQEKIKL